MTLRRTLTAILFLLLAGGLARLHAGPVGYTLEMSSGGGTVSIENDGAGKWTCSDAGKVYSVEKDAKGRFVLHDGGLVVARGKQEGEKLKFKTESGGFYLKLKIEGDKIKVETAEGAEPWKIKVKGDKAKLKRGDKEYGKAKFYPDGGKLKLKNQYNLEVAKGKGFTRLVAGPAALLMEGEDAAKKHLVMLVLFALGK